MSESHKFLLIAGAGALVLLLVAGRGVGRAIGNAAGGLATGAVTGIGDALGLPDPSDPVTQLEGEAALERGDYFEASTKLPVLEFLSGIGSQLGLGAAELVYGGDDAQAVHGTPGARKDDVHDPFEGWTFGGGA